MEVNILALMLDIGLKFYAVGGGGGVEVRVRWFR